MKNIMLMLIFLLCLVSCSDTNICNEQLTACSQNNQICQNKLESFACPACEQKECQPTIQIKEVEKIVKINDSGNKIRIQTYDNIIKQLTKGYYDDFLKQDYTICYNKLRNAPDLLLTVSGLYLQEGNKQIAKAYESYYDAILVISDYCKDRKDKTELNNDVIKKYNKYYKEYLLYSGNSTQYVNYIME